MSSGVPEVGQQTVSVHECDHHIRPFVLRLAPTSIPTMSRADSSSVRNAALERSSRATESSSPTHATQSMAIPPVPQML